MAFIKEDKNGNWYIYVSNQSTGRFNPRKHNKRKIFLIKDANCEGVVETIKRTIYFPKSFIGKRVQFKVEVIANKQ